MHFIHLYSQTKNVYNVDEHKCRSTLAADCVNEAKKSGVFAVVLSYTTYHIDIDVVTIHFFVRSSILRATIGLAFDFRAFFPLSHLDSAEHFAPRFSSCIESSSLSAVLHAALREFDYLMYRLYM